MNLGQFHILTIMLVLENWSMKGILLAGEGGQEEGENDASVQFLSYVQLSETPGNAAHQASLSITNSGVYSLMSIELVMPSSHLILCRPLLLPPSIFPSIRVFSNVSSSHQVAKGLEFQIQHQSFQ